MAELTLNQGCQIFLETIYQKGKTVPIDSKIYRFATALSICAHSIPNGRKRYQNFTFPSFQNIAKLWILV
jgi:hypothetical protein